MSSPHCLPFDNKVLKDKTGRISFIVRKRLSITEEAWYKAISWIRTKLFTDKRKVNNKGDKKEFKSHKL